MMYSSLAKTGLLFACLALTTAPSDGSSIDITCDALEGNQIDWDCIFGPGSLGEVHDRGGKFTTCTNKNSRHPCSRFIVPKEGERSEVKVKAGPAGFPFKKGEKYIYQYSWRAKEGMKVGKQYTHFGQLKGDETNDGTNMIFGVPIYSLTANSNGIMVRFSNLDTIENFHSGFEEHLSWNQATGQWVHVKITTVFGSSMKVTSVSKADIGALDALDANGTVKEIFWSNDRNTVELSGAVQGEAVWPQHLKPVAWHRDAKMVRMKLGLYHKTDKVADGEVEYRNIKLEGPNGKIRTSPQSEPAGILYRGCFEDDRSDRVLGKSKYVDAHMTTEMCEELCEGSAYFGLQYSTECWCGGANSRLYKHGKSDECTMTCPGNSRIRRCGGVYALSIYEYEGSPRDIPEDTDYVGCFADSSNDRALTLKETSNANMSYDTTPGVQCADVYARCDRFCAWSDAKYFAVQYGRECYCGSSKDDYDKHGEAICNMECAGDSSQVCGGFGTMNVFRVS